MRCYEKKLNGINIYVLRMIGLPNFSSAGCLGARLESVTPDARRPTDRHPTDRQTPGEYRANSGPARLVPGLELSNNEANPPHSSILLECCLLTIF